MIDFFFCKIIHSFTLLLASEIGTSVLTFLPLQGLRFKDRHSDAQWTLFSFKLRPQWIRFNQSLVTFIIFLQTLIFKVVRLFCLFWVETELRFLLGRHSVIEHRWGEVRRNSKQNSSIWKFLKYAKWYLQIQISGTTFDSVCLILDKNAH